MMMISAVGAISTNQNLSWVVESVVEWIRWLCLLWQRVPTITDSDTGERFPGGFGISWNANFQTMSSQVVCFCSHLENWLSTPSFPVNILYTLQ